MIRWINQQHNSFHGGSDMKRFMFLSIGVLCLAIVAINAAQAQDYEFMVWHSSEPATRLMAISSTGETYLQGGVNGLDLQNPPVACGNFWGSGQVPEGAQYLVYDLGTKGERVLAILPNGDVWRQDGMDGPGPSWIGPPSYVGNYWGGATSTSKSTWGGVKEQFKK
jgi:hypothetical protein